jgi:probable F420-dependent oxidoreductase
MLWCSFPEARGLAVEVESLGYRSLWMGEGLEGREAFSFHGALLAATSTLVTGTSVANMWARVPGLMAGGATLLNEAYPGRFMLGVGVSHSKYIERSGRDYGSPLEKARSYLTEMDKAAGDGPRTVPRLLAALRPKMLEVARDFSDGTVPYFVPVAHTERARAALGPAKLLIPTQIFAVEEDPQRAWAAAQQHVAGYLKIPNYVNNLRSLGYTDEELTSQGSDRLIEDIVALGSPEEIAARVRRHLDAGADHVLVQPIGSDSTAILRQLKALAPHLTQ